ncbi:alpha-N-acetylglucosaminidase [Streptomyces sp. NPDC001903]|uniref:alpha-N-acetylglucosaminidase n=1 Tax=Streptomyces sp. NPDC001903 TaxID=3364622 RepID=UPI00368630A9
MPRSDRPRPSRRSGLPALLALLALAAAPGGAPALPVPRPAVAAAPAPAVPSAGSARSRLPAARAALRRLLPPRHALQFTLLPGPRGADGQDRFTVSGRPGAVVVRGSTPATALTGVGWYLRNVARVDIGWPGDSLGALPDVLPGLPRPVTRTALVRHRYALNDTDDGYAGAYRTWEERLRQIDLLALHGINEVLVQVGAEYPYYAALRRHGYTAAELRAWIPGPAHQGWWLLQNLSGFGGPVGERLVEERAALGARVADELRALGMTPVLPGYFGTVPPGFADRNPGARVHPQGTWDGFARPDWLDPAGPVFADLAADYYAAQRARFGDSAMYRMSPLHEGGTAASVDVRAAAGAVQRALDAAHPGAIWAVLGWQDDPTRELLSGVDTSRMLIVDGMSERYENLDRETSWAHTPYALGTIHNFGGHTTIGANTGVWLRRFDAWRAKPDSALAGIAYMPEAGGVDPAAFALFTDLAWEPGPLDRKEWFAAYARRRYGGGDGYAAAAWEALRTGPYSTGTDSAQPQDGLFTARPSLTANRSSAWTPGGMRYPAASVRTALDALLKVSPRLRGSSAYRYDLVDTARQALANHSRVLLPRIRAAYGAEDLGRFRLLVGEWQRDERLLAAVTGSDRHFLFGRWAAAARSWGADEAERDRLEYDARSLLTTWGARTASEPPSSLHDYANREWAGLLEEFYAPRWARYFDSLDRALVSGAAPRPVDWYAVEDAWAHRTTGHPTRPSGDPYALARAVADALPPAGALA